MNDITIISTHFKDFLWIELLLEKLRRNTDLSNIREIIVINQDRSESSRDRLLKLDRLVRVVEYPVSRKHFELQGHDHAVVLNAAVLEARGKFICLFDSDAHPTNDGWLNRCAEKLTSYDAILAKCPDKPGAHPCFMFFKKEHTGIPLAFDEGLFCDGADTGRLVGDQLSRADQRVFYAEPIKCFSGRWGTAYLDSIYHHGSGSFHAGGPLLTAQLTWAHHFFRKRVLNDKKYELTFFREIQYRIMSAYLICRKPNLKPVKIFLITGKEKIKTWLFD